MKYSYTYKLLIVITISALAMIAVAQQEEQQSSDANTEEKRITSPKIGDQPDGSRTQPIHLIGLYDHNGGRILPELDDLLLPFSINKTCGKCHDIEEIAKGFHFNSTCSDAKPGRATQPWLYVDLVTGTQVPLSYRGLPGTFKPKDFGLTNWRFAKFFSRHYPGPVTENYDSDGYDQYARWNVSGEIEINCLACHDAERGHSQFQYARSIGGENFRWAPAASTAFATVTGQAANMPDHFDYMLPETVFQSSDKPPVITYDKKRFDSTARVLFDITRDVPNKRCYFCHSSFDIDKEKDLKREKEKAEIIDEENDEEIGTQSVVRQTWPLDEDVHVAAGLTCVDCHTNGLNHNITRGYEGEHEVSDNPLAAATSCKGCHLPDGAADIPRSGRFAAPEPLHKGLPTVHLEKLTCTACHSGPWPKDTPFVTQTSRAHGLGLHGFLRTAMTLPHILSPVFKRQADGKIAPHKMIWPSYWATATGESISPIEPELVRPVIQYIFPLPDFAQRTWTPFTEEQLTAALVAIDSESSIAGTPVYICGGKVYGLDENGKLQCRQNPIAEPYAWPIAHNVRPAAQSLGAKSCKDCHSTDKAFLFGSVPIDSPLKSHEGLTKPMTDFQQLDNTYAKLFAMSFVFRPMLKIVAIAASAIIAAVLLLFALKALNFIVTETDENT